MLNFAHGDVIMIGSYVVYFAFGASGLNPVLSIVLSMIVCTILGVVIERLAYRPLREAPSLAVLITAIGVSYLLQQVAQLSWSSNPKSFTSVVSGMKPVSLFWRSADHLRGDYRYHCGLRGHHGGADVVRQLHARRSRHAGCV